ncbi:MAG: TetR/AcrR family transcriptional regulator [Chlorobi bacterium]|nr:TetR/AcrR family transcriptional regulator [Chlorobiota bacterium]
MLSERQTEIVNRSIDIIASKGIQGLTIKNLSKEIGISEPAIYRHFESKTDILLTILKNFEEVSSFMNAAMKDENGTAVSKIEFMFTKIIEVFSNEPSHISVIFSEEIFKNEKVLKDKIVEIMSSKVKAIEEIIKDGQDKGEIRSDIDNQTLALIVVGSLRFMVKQWDLKDMHENLLPEGRKLIDGLSLILTKK